MRSRRQFDRPAARIAVAAAVAVLIPAAVLTGQALDEPAQAPTALSAPAPDGAGNGTALGARPPEPTIDACRTETITVNLGPAEVAAGTVHRPLRFTNTGRRPCVLHGFPDVAYVTADRYTQIGPAAEQDGDKGGPLVLPPRAVAYATMALSPVDVFDPARCRPVPAHGLRIYLPGEMASEFVPLSRAACSGKPTTGPQLRVRTILPGPGQG